MNKKLYLEFENEAQESLVMSFDNPKADLSQETVTAEMNKIIAASVFVAKGQLVKKAKTAYIVEQTKTELF